MTGWNRRDLAAGMMYIALGLIVAGVAATYPMGSATAMGPGYFPFWLGLLLAATGAVVVWRSRTNTAESSIGWWDVKSGLLVLGSAVIFGVLLPSLGVIATIVVVVMVASFASHEFGWFPALATAVILATMSLLIFVYGLGMPLPVWPDVMGR